MKVLNRYDEKNRFVEVVFYPPYPTEQADSHGLSYLKMREYLQEMEEITGLDNPNCPLTKRSELKENEKY